ncbi:MAG: polyprenyl synthetase family protein [Bacteroidales bacterium]|nr:polyprenyl synthetase family protein [Bacteroidales bacterium]
MEIDLKRLREATCGDWEKVEFLFRSALDSNIEILNDINAHILSNSGKQLRPLLSILAARACSGGHPSEASYRFAAASELLHNATLFHDDVADSSDERRGTPTLRASMGPTVSVLVGDFWLVRATRLVIGDDFNKLGGRVVELFSKTLSDLAEGEMLQLQKAQSGDTSEEDYLRIIYSKTASLFETAVLSAAISVGAESAVEDAAARYARSLGYAFQIGDDILDYSSSSEETGKAVGIDVCEGKITLPLLGAFRNAPEREGEIRAAIPFVGERSELRREIIDYVRENGGVDYAMGRLNEYVEAALAALAELPCSPDRDSLEEIARYIGHRKS